VTFSFTIQQQGLSNNTLSNCSNSIKDNPIFSHALSNTENVSSPFFLSPPPPPPRHPRWRITILNNGDHFSLMGGRLPQRKIRISLTLSPRLLI
jgi:hypothetical protein